MVAKSFAIAVDLDSSIRIYVWLKITTNEFISHISGNGFLFLSGTFLPILRSIMNTDRYALTSEEEFTRFEFISVGNKGAIRKLIEFQQTANMDVFNLAFGDKHLQTGQIDDLIVSDNGDTEKVLATVASAVYIFLEEHPTAYVYAQGSTRSRTRLYRMGITRFYEEVQESFFLYGRVGEDFFDFELNKEYEGFLAQRRFP